MTRRPARAGPASAASSAPLPPSRRPMRSARFLFAAHPAARGSAAIRRWP